LQAAIAVSLQGTSLYYCTSSHRKNAFCQH